MYAAQIIEQASPGWYKDGAYKESLARHATIK